MKRISRSVLAAFGTVAAASVALSLTVLAESNDITKDVQLHAMLDELARAKTLQLAALDKPYFISYSSDDADMFIANASLGGLLVSNRTRMRQPHIHVRVGDFNFDNTDSVLSQPASGAGTLPVDDNYGAIRGIFWLATDTYYKRATEDITRKRNMLRERSDIEKVADYSPQKAVQLVKPVPVLKIDTGRWNDIVRRLSGRFEQHPDIASSAVNFRAISSTYRLVNTEGTVVRVPEEFTDLQIRMTSLLPDGTVVWNHSFLTAEHPDGLPDEQQLAKAVDEVASETDALRRASAAEEYSGPVLFEGQASAGMLAQVLEDGLRELRKPLTPANKSLAMLESPWATRMGTKVTPDWMSVVDDPSATTFNNQLLLGHYLSDSEGVPGEKVVLIDKGTLKGFLMTRQPVRNLTGSNGHGRLPGLFGAALPVPGNLLVSVDQHVPEAQLKARHLEIVHGAGLKYGMIIRKLDFPSSAPINQLQHVIRQIQGSGVSRSITPAILAYRVYPDGREELVRGVRFKEFSAKDLRNVAAASDTEYVLNYVNNGSSFDWIDTPGEATVSSIVAPSLLFESIDLDRARDDLQRPPIVPPPAFVAKK
jgi:hypothetical protein